jgi:DNA invertase Pin-like site-specific DNA recombinase
MAKVRTPAVAYLRTSSAANVGSDKDSEHRQRAAVRAFAKRAGFEVADADWFYDAALSGADPIEGREGFARLLDRIEGNGICTVIIEEASRFARANRLAGCGLQLSDSASPREIRRSLFCSKGSPYGVVPCTD